MPRKFRKKRKEQEEREEDGKDGKPILVAFSGECLHEML
jgi:hypothetical protein